MGTTLLLRRKNARKALTCRSALPKTPIATVDVVLLPYLFTLVIRIVIAYEEIRIVKGLEREDYVFLSSCSVPVIAMSKSSSNGSMSPSNSQDALYHLAHVLMTSLRSRQQAR